MRNHGYTQEDIKATFKHSGQGRQRSSILVNRSVNSGLSSKQSIGQLTADFLVNRTVIRRQQRFSILVHRLVHSGLAIQSISQLLEDSSGLSIQSISQLLVGSSGLSIQSISQLLVGSSGLSIQSSNQFLVVSSGLPFWSIVYTQKYVL